jgi:diguanylate cyclase (GGDEF)-like protein
VLAVSSLLADQRNGLPWWKAGFNAGQYSLSIGAAAWVLLWLDRAPVGDPDDSPPFAVSLAVCAVFFVVNTVLPGIAIALREGKEVVRSLWADVPLQWSVNGVLVAMAPLVVAVANDSLWLVGLLVFPVVAVHRGALSALERDHMTLHDPLTGLPNQLAFRDKLVEQLEQARHTDRHVAVLVLAPDHIDDVTNTLGPSAADDLITQVAARLRSSVPEGAVLARLQGGGFGVAVPDLPVAVGGRRLRREAAPAVQRAVRLRRVGLRAAGQRRPDRRAAARHRPEQLMRHAEVARDLALRSRSGLEVYSEDRNAFTDRRLAVLRGLGPALRRRRCGCTSSRRSTSRPAR